MSTKKPIPCEKSARWIMSAASMLATQMNFERGGEITELVVELGGTITDVEPHELEGDVACITVPGHGTSFEIKIAKYIFPLQRRYAIVHDLGHYVLHSEFGKHTISASANLLNSAGDRAEYEAHLFASALLMPENEIQALPLPTTSEVAAYFQVPLHIAGAWIDCLNNFRTHESETQETETCSVKVYS